MRVTLSVDALQPHLTGIGRYTWELCKGLSSRREITSLNFFRGGVLIDDPARLLDLKREKRRLAMPKRWIQLRQARRVLRSSVVHGPNYFLPADALHGVITVHDLSVFRYPETHPESRIRSFDRSFANSLVRAAHVITDSEAVRKELIQGFSLSEGFVSAVPLGVDAAFHPRDKRALGTTLSQLGLKPGGYGLSVAAFEPRKRLAELIAAWRCLPSPTRTRFPLVLAGAAGWRNDELVQAIRIAQAEGWLKHLGYVDEHLLPALYAGSRLFIYPSIYEGFGLPPVEAMASGVPVIVSRGSSLVEVCGDAARFIDPDDPDGFTSAIEAGLADQQWRNRAISRGLQRARTFTWRRCVENTLAIYERVWMDADFQASRTIPAAP